jgi:hypothetical protein
MADEAKVAPAKAPTTATQPIKPASLPDGYKKKTGALQRKKKVIPKYNDYDDDQDSSEPEFAFPHREGKHRIIAARQSRITDRPQDGKEPTMVSLCEGII